MKTDASRRVTELKDFCRPLFINVPEDDLWVQASCSDKRRLLNFASVVLPGLPRKINDIILVFPILPERRCVNQVVEFWNVVHFFFLSQVFLNLFRVFCLFLIYLWFIFLILMLDQAPDFQNSIFPTCGKIESARTKFGGPDWLLMSSNILYQKHGSFKVLLTFENLRIDFLMHVKQIVFLILHLKNEWIIKTNLLSFLFKWLFHYSLQSALTPWLHKALESLTLVILCPS